MEDIVIKYGLIYIISLIIVYFFFRKMLYSIFDPAIWMIPMMASAVTLSYNTNLFIYIILCVAFFWLGMCMVNNNSIKRNFEPSKVDDSLTLEIYTILCCIIYSCCMIFLFLKNGIPLLSNNPTAAKIDVFEGSGMIRRISFLGLIIPINLIILIIRKKRKIFYFFLIVYCILKLAAGSKSSIIGLIFPLAYFITQTNLSSQSISFKKYKKYIIRIGIIGVFILVYIVSKEAIIEGGSLIYSLGFRFMEFGDALLYYSTETVQSNFQSYNLMNFIPDELNGITGMLRLTDYKLPLGTIMVEVFNGFSPETIIGPNTIFPVKGHIYFGFFGGIVYSFVIGIFFAAIRKYFFQIKIRNLMWYSTVAFVFFNCMGLIRESSSFLSMLFDYMFFSLPLLFFTQLLIKIYGRGKLQYYNNYSFL